MAELSPVLIGYHTLECFLQLTVELRSSQLSKAYIMYILDNLLNDNRFKYIEELLQLLSEFKFY